MNKLALVSLALLPSCASIVADNPKVLQLESTPSGLPFVTDYGDRGVTPASLFPPSSIKRMDVTLTGPGGERQTTTISRRPSYWMFGNVVFGGLIGLIVDLANPSTRVWPNEGQLTVNWEQGA